MIVTVIMYTFRAHLPIQSYNNKCKVYWPPSSHPHTVGHTPSFSVTQTHSHGERSARISQTFIMCHSFHTRACNCLFVQDVKNTSHKTNTRVEAAAQCVQVSGFPCMCSTQSLCSRGVVGNYHCIVRSLHSAWAAAHLADGAANVLIKRLQSGVSC